MLGDLSDDSAELSIQLLKFFLKVCLHEQLQLSNIRATKSVARKCIKQPGSIKTKLASSSNSLLF